MNINNENTDISTLAGDKISAAELLANNSADEVFDLVSAPNIDLVIDEQETPSFDPGESDASIQDEMISSSSSPDQLAASDEIDETLTDDDALFEDEDVSEEDLFSEVVSSGDEEEENLVVLEPVSQEIQIKTAEALLSKYTGSLKGGGFERYSNGSSAPIRCRDLPISEVIERRKKWFEIATKLPSMSLPLFLNFSTPYLNDVYAKQLMEFYGCPVIHASVFRDQLAAQVKGEYYKPKVDKIISDAIENHTIVNIVSAKHLEIKPIVCNGHTYTPKPETTYTPVQGDLCSQARSLSMLEYNSLFPGMVDKHVLSNAVRKISGNGTEEARFNRLCSSVPTKTIASINGYRMLGRAQSKANVDAVIDRSVAFLYGYDSKFDFAWDPKKFRLTMAQYVEQKLDPEARAGAPFFHAGGKPVKKGDPGVTQWAIDQCAKIFSCKDSIALNNLLNTSLWCDARVIMAVPKEERGDVEKFMQTPEGPVPSWRMYGIQSILLHFLMVHVFKQLVNNEGTWFAGDTISACGIDLSTPKGIAQFSSHWNNHTDMCAILGDDWVAKFGFPAEERAIDLSRAEYGFGGLQTYLAFTTIYKLYTTTDNRKYILLTWLLTACMAGPITHAEWASYEKYAHQEKLNDWFTSIGNTKVRTLPVLYGGKILHLTRMQNSGGYLTQVLNAIAWGNIMSLVSVKHLIHVDLVKPQDCFDKLLPLITPQNIKHFMPWRECKVKDEFDFLSREMVNLPYVTLDGNPYPRRVRAALLNLDRLYTTWIFPHKERSKKDAEFDHLARVLTKDLAVASLACLRPGLNPLYNFMAITVQAMSSREITLDSKLYHSITGQYLADTVLPIGYLPDSPAVIASIFLREYDKSVNLSQIDPTKTFAFWETKVRKLKLSALLKDTLNPTVVPGVLHRKAADFSLSSFIPATPPSWADMMMEDDEENVVPPDPSKFQQDRGVHNTLSEKKIKLQPKVEALLTKAIEPKPAKPGKSKTAKKIDKKSKPSALSTTTTTTSSHNQSPDEIISRTLLMYGANSVLKWRIGPAAISHLTSYFSAMGMSTPKFKPSKPFPPGVDKMFWGH